MTTTSFTKPSLLHSSAALMLAALAFGPTAFAQNLLTNNPGFEANTAYYTPGWGWPQGSPDALPGWLITLDDYGDGYAGAGNNQSPKDLEGSNFGYIYSGTGSSGVLATAPGSRAAVEKDTLYTLWFRARGDCAWDASLATFSLVWYPNNNDWTTVGDPTNLDLTFPARGSTDDAMQMFSITATAPPGAHFAGVCITKPPDDYNSILVDDFVLTAEPAQISLSMKQHGSHATVSWRRSARFKLQQCDSLDSAAIWQDITAPVRSDGTTNSVDSALTNHTHFFRLVAPGNSSR